MVQIGIIGGHAVEPPQVCSSGSIGNSHSSSGSIGSQAVDLSHPFDSLIQGSPQSDAKHARNGYEGGRGPVAHNDSP